MFQNMIRPTEEQQDRLLRALLKERACADIEDAYTEAVRKHPDSTWPKDVVHQVAIMAEEAGEAVRAANDVLHSGGDIQALRRELAQCGAMCLRCLIHLPQEGNQ